MTPPGSGSRAPAALYAGAGRPLGGSGSGPGDDDPKRRGGWKLCARCGCATMRRCGGCRATICQQCEKEHLKSDCLASKGLCAVCGPQPTISACIKCNTRFCPDHQRHDCPTPVGDGGASRHEALGQVREELEKKIPQGLSPGAHKSKITMEAPGGWDNGAGVGPPDGDETMRNRRPGGTSFLSGARSEPSQPAEPGGSRVQGVPMARDGGQPRSWANPTMIQAETQWVSSLGGLAGDPAAKEAIVKQRGVLSDFVLREPNLGFAAHGTADQLSKGADPWAANDPWRGAALVGAPPASAVAAEPWGK